MKEDFTRGLSIREFAYLNSVSESMVRRRVATGDIPSYKVGKARRIPAIFVERLQQCKGQS
jgi:excisionase family DNA binding protein